MVYLRQIDGLEKLRQEYDGLSKPLTEQRLISWFHLINHEIPKDRHKEQKVVATAYFRQQRIVYNPLVLQRMLDGPDWEKQITEVVAHEMGHLFDWKFLHRTGHSQSWYSTGQLVGYSREKLPRPNP